MNLVAVAPHASLIGKEVVVQDTSNGCGQGGTCTAIDGSVITIQAPYAVFTYDTATHFEIEVEEPMAADECIEFHQGDCSGPVDYHTVGNSMRAFARCEFHINKRWKRYDDPNSSERFADSDLAPSSFHRSWGGANEFGEHWSEEDY